MKRNLYALNQSWKFSFHQLDFNILKRQSAQYIPQNTYQAGRPSD